uniref:Putative secreted protein n=1 Tax=Panstrongylus lignarius TaxID=156445 RepID=A0A224XTN4_9HEMI
MMSEAGLPGIHILVANVFMVLWCCKSAIGRVNHLLPFLPWKYYLQRTQVTSRRTVIKSISSLEIIMTISTSRTG